MKKLMGLNLCLVAALVVVGCCADADDSDGCISDFTACDTGLSGICASGITVCESGELVCSHHAEPSDEICNGADDDCDGQTDEGC